MLITSRRAKFALARSADDTLDTVVNAFNALGDEEQAVRTSFDYVLLSCSCYIYSAIVM